MHNEAAFRTGFIDEYKKEWNELYANPDIDPNPAFRHPFPIKDI